MKNNNPLIPDVPFHPGPVYRPCPNPSNKMCQILRVHKVHLVQKILTLILIWILRKILHFKKELCLKPFTDKSFYQEPKELGDLVNKGNLIHKFLPKQADIDTVLKVIQRKVLKGTHLLVEIKEIQAGYLHSSYFKNIYL